MYAHPRRPLEFWGGFKVFNLHPFLRALRHLFCTRVSENCVRRQPLRLFVYCYGFAFGGGFFFFTVAQRVFPVSGGGIVLGCY